MRRKHLDLAANSQFRAIEWIEVQLAVGTDDAKLDAPDAGVPSSIDDAVDAAGKLHHDGGRVFHRNAMHGVGEQTAHALGLPEEKVYCVDAVRRDVVERPAASQSR